MSWKDLGKPALTSEEESLLTRLVDNDVREIKQRIGPEGIIFEELADIVEDYEKQDIRQLLKSLAEKGALIAKEKDRSILCQNCGSPLVISRYRCPRCNSEKVDRIELIEHSFCGYTGVREKFISGSALICPNCKTKLGSFNERPIGDGSKKDYRIIGSSFECEKCGNRFNKPDVSHTCQNCGAVFDYKTARYEKLYDYEIPEHVIKIMRSPKECTILLIEDNPDDAKIIIRYFAKSEESFKIEHVVTGREGLEKITSKYFDLILLDYKLPDMNGLEVIKEVKGRNIEVPIIILTGADDRKTAVEAMKVGASDYIVKSLKVYETLPNITQKITKE